MRILSLVTKSEIGGVQKNILLLSQGLKEEGYDVFVGSGEIGYLTNELNRSGIKTIFLKNLKRTNNPFTNLFFVCELRRFLKKENLDIISFNSSNTLFGVLSILSLRNKPKTVFTVHGSGFLSPGFKRSKISKLLLLCSMRVFIPLFDKIIFVSEYDKRLAEEYNLVKSGGGEIIYNGIEDINFFNKEEAIKRLKEIRNFPDSKLIIGTITRLEYAKGNDILIDIVSGLSKEILDKCIFLIIGDGPDRENLKSQISNLRLENKILLLGEIPEVAKYLKAFDIFIMPSRYEGMPYALLEAMSAGLPVIASRVGGVPELIGDTGILIEQGNIDSFDNALVDLINDPRKREVLSQETKKRSRQFSFDKNLEKIKNLFTSLDGSR